MARLPALNDAVFFVLLRLPATKRCETGHNNHHRIILTRLQVWKIMHVFFLKFQRFCPYNRHETRPIKSENILKNASLLQSCGGSRPSKSYARVLIVITYMSGLNKIQVSSHLVLGTADRVFF